MMSLFSFTIFIKTIVHLWGGGGGKGGLLDRRGLFEREYSTFKLSAKNHNQTARGISK